jgi:NADPH-dependent curcumin reductase CurA
VSTNRRFLLARRPQGLPAPEDFELVREPLPTVGPGSFLVRNRYVSLDPAQRIWMDEAPSYMPPIPLGQPVRALAIGVVEQSDNPDFAPGDWVFGQHAIEDYTLVETGEPTRKIDVSIVDRPTRYLSAISLIGFTAYFGLLAHGKPQAGETLLVSGAAGAVGSIVGQIGRIRGCRVIGVAGGAEKVRRLTEDYGFDAAIDYRGKDVEQLAAEIGSAAPHGVDIVFENVGSTPLDAALLKLAMRARIVICGMISDYNRSEKSGARNLFQLVVKRASMEGFIVTDHIARFPEASAQIAHWLGSGELRVDEDVQEGMENTHAAFMRLFSGTNTGKLILRIA